MPVNFVTGEPKDIQKHLPPGARCAKLKNITSSWNDANAYIKGVVLTKYPIHRYKNKSTLLKLKLKEECSGDKIDVYLLDNIAEECQDVGVRDAMALSSVRVEDCTHPGPGSHCCQILADKDANVWVVHGAAGKVAEPSQGKSASFSQLSPISNTSKRTERYTYTQLKDLQPLKEFNVFGIVKFIRPPVKSKGTDFSLMFSIVDQSCHGDRDKKLKCLLFGKDPKLLPPVNKVGDIVRLHRIKVVEYQGQLQGLGGRAFASLVFDGEPGASLTPRTASTSYTFTEEDQDKVAALRDWSAGVELAASQEGTTATPASAPQVPVGLKTLHEVCRGDFFDFICQVVATCVVTINARSAMLLRVWDATQTVFELYREDKLVEEFRPRYKEDPDLTRRSIGLTADVFVFDNHFNQATNVSPGDFVKFTNLHACIRKKPDPADSADVELDMHGGGATYRRMIDILASDSPLVNSLRQRLEASSSPNSGEAMESTMDSVDHDLMNMDSMIASGRKRSQTEPITEDRTTPKKTHTEDTPSLGQPSLATSVATSVNSTDEDRCMLSTATVIVGHRDVRKTPLKDLVAHSVPYKFRVRCQLKDYQPKPTCVRDLIKLYCPSCDYSCAVPGDGSKESAERGFEAEHEEVPEAIISNLPRPIDSGRTDKLRLYHCPKCYQDEAPTPSTDTESCMEYTYMLQLMLTDRTGWITAGLWRKEAEAFFHDITAEDLLKNETNFAEISACIQRLCPRPGHMADGPLMECCIKSYTTDGGTCFQVFDTTLELTDSRKQSLSTL